MSNKIVVAQNQGFKAKAPSGVPNINSNNTSDSYGSPGTYIYILKQHNVENYKIGFGKIAAGGWYDDVAEILNNRIYTIKCYGQRLVEPIYWFQVNNPRAEYLLKIYLHEYQTGIHKGGRTGEWFAIPHSILTDIQDINWFNREVAIWNPATNNYTPSEAVWSNLYDFGLHYEETAEEKAANQALLAGV